MKIVWRHRMKTAVIADIHGNREALKRILEDIESRGIERIICLGDIVAKGIHNHDCVQLVKEKCDIAIAGNCDEYFSRDAAEAESERERKLIEAYQATMEKEDIEWLASLPYCHEETINGRLVRMFHAGPDSLSNDESNTLYASPDKRFSMFEAGRYTLSKQTADIVIFGHVHIQTMTRLYNRTLICCGSVGNPLDIIRNPEKDGPVSNTAEAQYLIMEDHAGTQTFSFVQVPYDIEKELIEGKDFFEYEQLSYELRNAAYRRNEKIRAILTRDGISFDQI